MFSRRFEVDELIWSPRAPPGSYAKFLVFNTKAHLATPVLSAVDGRADLEHSQVEVGF